MKKLFRLILLFAAINIISRCQGTTFTLPPLSEAAGHVIAAFSELKELIQPYYSINTTEPQQS